MDDKLARSFLTLKFLSIDDAIDRFGKAVGMGRYAVPAAHVDPDDTLAAVKYWVEQGAPDTLEIPDELVELFLRVKFGTIKRALYHLSNFGKVAFSKQELIYLEKIR